MTLVNVRFYLEFPRMRVCVRIVVEGGTLGRKVRGWVGITISQLYSVSPGHGGFARAGLLCARRSPRVITQLVRSGTSLLIQTTFSRRIPF